MIHAVLIMFLDYATGDAQFRQGAKAGTGAGIFGMAIAALIVIPGAVIGWWVRGKELKVWAWLSVTLPYWLAVSAISCGAMKLSRIIMPIALVCVALAVLLLVTSGPLVPEERRRRKRTKEEPTETAEKISEVQGNE